MLGTLKHHCRYDWATLTLHWCGNYWQTGRDPPKRRHADQKWSSMGLVELYCKRQPTAILDSRRQGHYQSSGMSAESKRSKDVSSRAWRTWKHPISWRKELQNRKRWELLRNRYGNSRLHWRSRATPTAPEPQHLPTSIEDHRQILLRRVGGRSTLQGVVK